MLSIYLDELVEEQRQNRKNLQKNKGTREYRENVIFYVVGLKQTLFVYARKVQ